MTKVKIDKDVINDICRELFNIKITLTCLCEYLANNKVIMPEDLQEQINDFAEKLIKEKNRRE